MTWLDSVTHCNISYDIEGVALDPVRKIDCGVRAARLIKLSSEEANTTIDERLVARQRCHGIHACDFMAVGGMLLWVSFREKVGPSKIFFCIPRIIPR